MIDAEAVLRLLDDRTVVRYPTTVRFDSGPLQPGEFAYAAPLGERPEDGFCLYVHPMFRDRPDALPLLVSYHIPPINYGEIVACEDCEQFGAALMGLEPDWYYGLLCGLSDSIPAPERSDGDAD